mmetsp:Transcript_2782/g.6465  ORF Transcript_2782/g.6465 Transcript_2782/m.6465 type:complete len:468 (+) Transcript_2782:148-1551(+)
MDGAATRKVGVEGDDDDGKWREDDVTGDAYVAPPLQHILHAASPSLQLHHPRDAKKAEAEWQKHRDEMDEGGIVENVNVKFLYRPRRLLALAALLGYMGYELYYESDSRSENGMKAMRACAACILTVGSFVFPRGPFIRPHPLVWRFIFGLMLLYELLLISLLYQRKKDARELLENLDPNLNTELEEQDYATNCEVTWLNILKQFDVFVLCHAIGWALKAVVLRDRLILWHMSVTWEFVEMTLSYKLPNFAECWWDHWLMDVLLCNGVGIEVGIWICKYLEVKKYHWLSIFDYPTFCGKVNRTILQFTPESWIRVEWDCFRNTRRYLEIHLVMLVFQLIDLNSFFLKRLLWIPTKHYINAARLLLLCTNGLVVIRQYYVLISHPTYDRIGLHSWLFYIVLATELMLIFKFSRNEFKEPMPEEVKSGLFWGGLGYLSISIAGLLYSSFRSASQRASNRFSISDRKKAD